MPYGRLCDAAFLRAADMPLRTAVITPTLRLSFCELMRLAAQLADVLRSKACDIKCGDRVATLLSKSAWMPVAAYGIHMAGAAYVPLDPLLPLGRIEDITSDAAIRIVVSTKEHVSRAWPDTVAVLPIDGMAELAGNVPMPAPPQSPSGLAYVIFTSGSTGRPKGVMLDHAGPLNVRHSLTARTAATPHTRPTLPPHYLCERKSVLLLARRRPASTSTRRIACAKRIASLGSLPWGLTSPCTTSLAPLPLAPRWSTPGRRTRATPPRGSPSCALSVSPCGIRPRR